MIASTMSLKRMADRKLRRWGISPSVRGDGVMLVQTRPFYLPLRDFFTVLQVEEEIKMANPNESMNSVLSNRIKRYENAFDRYKAYLDTKDKDREDKIDDMTGEYVEMLKSSQSIQVQVK